VDEVPYIDRQRAAEQQKHRQPHREAFIYVGIKFEVLAFEQRNGEEYQRQEVPPLQTVDNLEPKRGVCNVHCCIDRQPI